MVEELIVEDTTPEVYEKFDVTGLGAVTFPAGADQVVVLACTEPASACVDDADFVASAPQTGGPLTLPVPAADVTGLRFVFSSSAGAELPYDPTGGTVEVDLVLRDTLRSTGAPYQPTVNDRIENCASPSATEATAGTTAGVDVCSGYTVLPAAVTIGVAKSFFSDTDGNFSADGRAVVGLDSPVSALTSVTNTSQFPISTITIVEPSATATSEFEKVDATDLRLVFPTGATTATLSVDCGAGPVETDFTAPPPTIDVAAACADPALVAVTYTGLDATGAGTITPGAVGRLGVHGTLNDLADDTDVTNGPGAAGDGVTDCADGAATSSLDGVAAAAGTACGTLALWVAYSDVTGTKSAQLPSILPGLPRLFTLSFTNGGTVPATDVVLADPLDPTAAGNVFDSVRLADLVLPATPPATAEVYDPTVPGYVTYDAGNAALLERARGFRITVASLPPGATYAMQFNVILRDGVPTGATFQNCAGVGSASQVPSQFCSQTLTVQDFTSSAALQKALDPAQSVRPQAGLPGTPVQLKLQLQNTGTLFLRQLAATDADPGFYDAVDLSGEVLVNFPPGSDRVRVDACTGGCTDAEWVLGAVTASTSPGLPAGVAAGDVRGVRVTFTAVPVSTPTFPDGDEYRIRPGTNFPTSGPCTNASVCVRFVPRVDLRSAPGTPVPDVLVNTANGLYESRLQPPGQPAAIPPTTSTHTLTPGTAGLQFSKSPDRTAAPGESIPFVLRTQNTGTGPIPGLTIVEPIPEGLDFSPLDLTVPYDIVYTLPAGAPEPATVEFTATVDPDTGLTTELRWTFPDWDFLPGSVVSIQIRTVLAPGVIAGQTILNTAGASGDRPDLACNLANVPRPGQVVDDPAFGPGRFCTSAAEVSVGEGNAFRTQKWVAGDPDLGFLNSQTGVVVPLDDPACPRLTVGGQLFTRFPCVARVLPGQGFDYYLQLTNSGTNPATEVRLVDVFPHPGDTGVLLTGSARGTEWSEAPTLLTPVSLVGQGSAVIDYTSAPAPVCTTDLNLPPVPCAAGSWPLGGYDSSATAFRAFITFDAADLLLPGETTALRFRMAAPPDPAGATDDVAWNSFGHTEFFQSGPAVAQLPPTEPIKVGVAIGYGGLTIAKTVDDPDGSSAGLTFDISYECSVTPASGDPPTVVAEGVLTLAAGEQASLDVVPAGARCLVWEPDARGLISNAPERDSALVVDIPIDASVEIATAEIVNSQQPPASTTTTTTTDPGSATTTDPGGSGVTTTTVRRPGGSLPSTGSGVAPVLTVAAVFVALGAVAVVGRRRWRRT